jgi:excisionase family DNA binding protein
MVERDHEHDPVPPSDDGDLMNLKEVARALGVHYMTAYRYVRHGRLPAERHLHVWLVRRADVEAFVRPVPRAGRNASVDPSAPPGDGQRSGDGQRGGDGQRSEPGGDRDPTGPVSGRTTVDWTGRFRQRLLAGDEVGAWTVVTQAQGSGFTPQRCLLELVSRAMAQIGDDVAAERLAIADQYVATAIAQRIGARVGARFRRGGRDRGTVVLGAPTGEHHALPIAVVADLVRLAGFAVVELGANVPPEAFGLAARRAVDPIAVGIGVTQVTYLDAARATIERVRYDAPGVPVLLGGRAVRNPEVAGLVGVAVWAADGSEVVAAVECLAADRRRRAGRDRAATATTAETATTADSPASTAETATAASTAETATTDPPRRR